jgi:hypothetical protein
MIVHCYLDEKPRYKHTAPLNFAVESRSENEDAWMSVKSNFDMEMKLMREAGYDREAIDDIFACVREDDFMP